MRSLLLMVISLTLAATGFAQSHGGGSGAPGGRDRSPAASWAMLFEAPLGAASAEMVAALAADSLIQIVGSWEVTAHSAADSTADGLGYSAFYPPYYYEPYYYGPYYYGYPPYGYAAPLALVVVPRPVIAGPGVILGGGWRRFGWLNLFEE
jgi:hypothetical protein